MSAFRLSCLACATLVLVAIGCSSPRQIQTSPPQSAIPTTTDSTNTPAQAAFSILVESGVTPLPDDVQSLRFRVAELQLRSTQAGWQAFPSDLNIFEITRGQRVRKVVLATQLTPATYDSLSIALSDVYVEYDANAGAPLTLPHDTPIRLPLVLSLSNEYPTMLRLVFEPGASLTRDANHRWFFLPFFETLVQ